MKTHYQREQGSININGTAMSWTMTRSKGESIFGIRGSRIFQLELKKNGEIIGVYDRGWTTVISKDDKESNACVQYLVDKFGKQRSPKERSKPNG